MKVRYFLTALVLMMIALFTVSACSDKESAVLPAQMNLPEVGDEIMIVHTSVGDIKIKLLPKDAPETVRAIKQVIEDNEHVNTPLEKSFQANLIKSIKERDNAYYKTLFDEGYIVETDPDIRHYPGAVGLSMYMETEPSSSFYIITSGGIEKDYLDVMRALTEQYPEAIVDNYERYGGLPSIDMGYTIFGQVFEGMDIVDKIYSIKHDQYTLELEETVLIESIELASYE